MWVVAIGISVIIVYTWCRLNHHTMWLAVQMISSSMWKLCSSGSVNIKVVTVVHDSSWFTLWTVIGLSLLVTSNSVVTASHSVNVCCPLVCLQTGCPQNEPTNQSLPWWWIFFISVSLRLLADSISPPTVSDSNAAPMCLLLWNMYEVLLVILGHMDFVYPVCPIAMTPLTTSNFTLLLIPLATQFFRCQNCY